jgi:hypothetical protein
LGIGVAAKIGVTVPITGGASLALGGASFGLLTWGSSEIAFGIADLNLALKTPDGMSAESYGTLVNSIGEGFGINRTSQGVLNLAISIFTGGKKIPSNLYSSDFLKILDAFKSSGDISEDLIEVLKIIYENEKKEEENQKEKDEEEKDHKE